MFVNFVSSALVTHVVLAACLVGSAFSLAAPVPTEERIPVDVRRTTFIVEDVDKSLTLYRDALGLQVIYDQVLASPLPDGGERKRRLVLLQANDDFIGAIGLLEYMQPRKPQRQEQFDEPVPGDPIVVINAQDLDKRWGKVVAAADVQVITAPHLVHYPRADGGQIAVMMSMIRDADGYWLEINQLLDAPARAEDASKAQ
ncbi:VOC family protein [Alkalimonas sp.]|uniref:VOC family protein n=1 Tax=Alkalimonas sp. TaxID=1872453 RepID=UPI00263BAEE0|nr:VOC family protein [Alkalimonas sp.]MCC5825091.1 VOC family protein [Alkalimonas sp.]